MLARPGAGRRQWLAPLTLALRTQQHCPGGSTAVQRGLVQVGIDGADGTHTYRRDEQYAQRSAPKKKKKKKKKTYCWI